MNKLTTIKNAKDLALQSTMLAEGTSAIAKFSTVEECKHSFENAEQIVDSFYEREREGAITFIRANALLQAKRLVMGEFWNQHMNAVPADIADKWYDFLSELGLDTQGQKAYVNNLLKFGNYNESSKLLGCKVAATGYEYITKLSGAMKKNSPKGKPASPTDVAKTYNELAIKYNNAKPFGNAKSMLDAYETEMKGLVPPEPKPKPKKEEEDEPVEDELKEEARVYVRTFFEGEVGLRPEIIPIPELQSNYIAKAPKCSRKEWKKFYKRVSKMSHPDSETGDETMFGIIQALNEGYTYLLDARDATQAAKAYDADYAQWKEDNGYDDDFVAESQLQSYHQGIE